MSRKWLFETAIGIFLLSCTLPALAQESAVKGNLAGTVYDTTGAVVPEAKVTLGGPTGTRSINSDEAGNFLFPLLIPGFYSVKVEKSGFKVADVKGVEVVTDRTATVHVTLVAGAPTQVVEVTAPAVRVDTTSTAVAANLTDTFYQQVPVQRNVAGLFYLSSGVASGGTSGVANPSISGGSGLENLYVADGVNITDSAFGGLGVFSRVYGSLATGINLSFVKEVQVKTGGYEPQYGKATGGIVQIVTKSGSSEYHGAVAGFFAPQQFEAERKHPDDFGRKNLAGKTLHQGNFDASAEVGGYVPGARNHLFFFGSVDPSWGREYDLAPPTFGLSRLGTIDLRTNAFNYAFKGTYKVNDKHQAEFSIFGDPSHTSTGPNSTLTIDNQTAFSKLEFGTRNLVARYNGTLSPTWLVNASFTWGNNRFNETNFANLYQIVDRTQTSGLPGQRGVLDAVGLGFFETTKSNTYGVDVGTSKDFRFAGSHTFSIGYRLELPHFDGHRDASGPRVPIPGTNTEGDPLTDLGVPASAIGTPVNAQFSLRRARPSCTLCPLFNVPGRGLVPVFLSQIRGEFGPPNFKTKSTYHAAYAEDSWRPNKYVTVNLGLRWEIQRLVGGAIQYSFTGNWLPRVGVAVDPWGDRRTKIYANFGRYDYVLPLDVAERSLSNELDFIGARWAPDFTIDPATGNRIATVNAFGTVNPVLDAAHLLTGAAGGTGAAIGVSTQSAYGFAPGTKMEYEDEFVVGFEREMKGGVIVSARYLDRRLKRIVEDTGGISPEAFTAGVPQTFLIANVGKSTDIFTNPIEHTFPADGTPDPACDPTLVNPEVTDTFGNILGGVCFETNGVNGQPGGGAIPDGAPDGFPDPVRTYQAVEIEATKSFSHNWQLRANWRIAKLFGNFEGAFRNDNGQTDPGISSLFDFTAGQFGLLGDQFKPGVLNTDRRHIVNFYTSYVLDRSRLKGLTLGAGVRFDSGIPINDLKAHPAYENSGEVPVGGRGALGRTPVDGSVDLHVDYPIRIGERKALRVGGDFFNIADARRQLRVDQNEDSTFGVKNLDFQKPVGRITGFQRPFYARGFVRFEF